MFLSRFPLILIPAICLNWASWISTYPHKTSKRLIIRNEDGEVITFLKQHSAQYHACVVELTEKDCEELGMQVE